MKKISNAIVKSLFFDIILLEIIYFFRGYGAVGSASHWQCGGQGFESP
jgi:hypothetical protein